jgi:metallo-beta-lactamase family protein
VLVIESTYGDRLHEDAIDARRRLARELVEHAIRHRSKVIVPAFAVGRTQEIIMRIKEMVKAGVVDPIPIYIDSPLALQAMQVFRRHPECFDEETYRTFTSEGDPFAAKYIRYVTTAKDSKALNVKKGPLVIISASGMCEGGRVVHHLKHTIEDEANVIALVGWQAEHTLGRNLWKNGTRCQSLACRHAGEPEWSGSMVFLLTQTETTCWPMSVPFSPFPKRCMSSMGKSGSPWPLP